MLDPKCELLCVALAPLTSKNSTVQTIINHESSTDERKKPRTMIMSIVTADKMFFNSEEINLNYD